MSIYPINPPSITKPPSQGFNRTDIEFRLLSSSLRYKDLDKLAREITTKIKSYGSVFDVGSVYQDFSMLSFL